MISIEDYLKSLPLTPLIDVRSPGEFKKGHIPGAINIPLFSDEERAIVGTAYKQISKERAIEIGLGFVQPKLQDFIKQSFQAAPEGKAVIHCWRGGMRSQAFAKHLAENGFPFVDTIEGGYKSFRTKVLHEFYKNYSLRIIGGYTGSGKTTILQHLSQYGLQVIDLEGIAKHKGSAFGKTSEEQPSIEQFENNIFWQWKDLDLSQPIWLEDESHNIGSVKIPMGLYQKMRQAEVYFLEIPKIKRAQQLVKDYSVIEKSILSGSLLRISRKLGDLHTRTAQEYLENDNFLEVAILALNYYDKYYKKGMELRETVSVHKISLPTTDPKKNALSILKYYKSQVNE